MMSNSWTDLENFVKDFLDYDQSVRTPLSGGTKNEEDVVGLNLISQCKYTEDKNISILKKDLDRLIAASRLLDKFPLFFNESQSGKTVAIPINNETVPSIQLALKLICAHTGIAKLRTVVEATTDIRQLRECNKELEKLNNIILDIRRTLSTNMKKLETRILVKESDILSYDLFDSN